MTQAQPTDGRPNPWNYSTITLNWEDHSPLLSSGWKDPLSGETLVDGDVVVACAECQTVFLESSWREMGIRHCGQEGTLPHLPELGIPDVAESAVYQYRAADASPSQSAPMEKERGVGVNRWLPAIAVALCLSVLIFLAVLGGLIQRGPANADRPPREGSLSTEKSGPEKVAGTDVEKGPAGSEVGTGEGSVTRDGSNENGDDQGIDTLSVGNEDIGVQSIDRGDDLPIPPKPFHLTRIQFLRMDGGIPLGPAADSFDRNRLDSLLLRLGFAGVSNRGRLAVRVLDPNGKLIPGPDSSNGFYIHQSFTHGMGTSKYETVLAPKRFWTLGAYQVEVLWQGWDQPSWQSLGKERFEVVWD